MNAFFWECFFCSVNVFLLAELLAEGDLKHFWECFFQLMFGGIAKLLYSISAR